MRRFTVVTLVATSAAVTPALAATTYVRPPYGCYRIDAADLNIRERAFAASVSIATAAKGQIVIKSNRFCNWRGYFCAVEFTRDGRTIRGYADKAYMTVVPCPADFARPVN